MAGVRFFKVDNLPPEPAEPHALYFVKCEDGISFRPFITDQGGLFLHARVAPLQMAIRSSPGLIPADEEIGRYLATENLSLDSAISGMVADVAATNETSFTVHFGLALVARLTFAAGQAQALVEVLIPAIPKGSLLIFRTPAVQDPTLEGVTGTLGARRA